jgi:uncharacterized protein (DUF488 family)
MAQPATLVSIGYERRTPAELVALLQAQGVASLLDVRALPLSRRPGFSKTPLSRRLAAAGIGYIHVRQAGNPYHARDLTPAQCLARYRRYLDNRPAIAEAVARHINGSAVAVLCFEKRHAACHRSLLAEAVRRLLPELRLITIE